VILVVLRDEAARARCVDELRRRYDADYQVRAHAAAAEAVADLDRLHEDSTPVALVLADAVDALPDGRTVFEHARGCFPDVRRGLLIEWGAWADPAVAPGILRLMATGQIDYYVIRPWHSPDEYFHRTVTEFLLEWERTVGDRPREVTLVAPRGSPRAHELRSMLGRNGVPHAFHDSASEQGAAILAGLDDVPPDTPVVVLHDGRVLVDPDRGELAAAYGMSTDLPDDAEVDVVVVGAGPGGLAAAVYASSEGLTTTVIESESIGGQAGSSSLIRNYLGFSRGVSGTDLSQRAYQQAWVFGTDFVHAREATGLRVEGENAKRRIVVEVGQGRQVRAGAVVLATGVAYRRLGVPELEEFRGAGLYYGASAFEAKALTGGVAHVVGGGNSAGQAALHLARYAREVNLLVRGPSLAESMSQYLIDQLDAAGVRVRLETGIVGGGGDGRLDHVVLRDARADREVAEPTDGIFVLIGAAPHTGWLPEAVLRDQWGYLLTGPGIADQAHPGSWPLLRAPLPLETSVPGVFAVGDVRRASVKRVASAVGEGSVVISQVHAFLAELEARA
jgi:thioredoxin reductase (NADPH)